MEDHTEKTVAGHGGKNVRRLVAENLNLMRKEARRQAVRWAGDEPADVMEELYRDLEQAGFFGLHRAAEKFDPARGCAFSTYAMPWIRKTIGDEARAWRADHAHASLDAPAGGDGDATLGDFLPDERAEDPAAAVDRALAREYAHALLARLPERDRAMVEMHYGIGGGRAATFAEIGLVFGISTQRAARIVDRALRRMRAA